MCRVRGGLIFDLNVCTSTDVFATCSSELLEHPCEQTVKAKQRLTRLYSKIGQSRFRVMGLRPQLIVVAASFATCRVQRIRVSLATPNAA